MKYLNTTLFTILSVILVLSSCSIEKRVHLSGFHAKWKKSNHKSDINELNVGQVKQSFPSNDNFTYKEENELIKKDFHKESSRTEYVSAVPEKEHKTDHNNVINNHDSSIKRRNVLIGTKPIINSSIDKVITPDNIKKITYEEKMLLTQKTTASSSNNDYINTIVFITGLLFFVGGIILFLFVSILFGSLLGALGLIFLILGSIKNGNGKSSNKESENQEYVDVVYLKNGGVIRGMIIEQIPNESLKIQTSDKSIFVYKMEEIQKITKELR